MDCMIRVFDIQRSTPIKTLEGHTGRVYNVVFNPRLPNILASGSDDRSIRIWDISLPQTTSIYCISGTGSSSH